MAEYRSYIRYAEFFDGVTPETAVYTQNKVTWTTTTDTEVGVFSPASLGRVNVASMARLAFEGLLTDPHQLILVTTATGTPRYTAPVSRETSGWLYLAPQDHLVLRCSVASKVDILIRDLNGEEIDEYARDEALEALSP